MAHPRFGDIAVCVFDAYGTLFDYNAAAGRHVAVLGDKAGPLAELWRHKQLQYTWLRSLMGRYTGSGKSRATRSTSPWGSSVSRTTRFAPG